MDKAELEVLQRVQAQESQTLRVKTYINIRFSLFGLHNWPNASKTFREVAFLDNLHSHTFNFRLKFQVFHNDRDKEFFVEKAKIIRYLKERYEGDEIALNFGANSCEHLANELLEVFDALEVEVQEDNLDSAICVKCEN